MRGKSLRPSHPTQAHPIAAVLTCIFTYVEALPLNELPWRGAVCSCVATVAAAGMVVGITGATIQQVIQSIIFKTAHGHTGLVQAPERARAQARTASACCWCPRRPWRQPKAVKGYKNTPSTHFRACTCVRPATAALACDGRSCGALR